MSRDWIFRRNTPEVARWKEALANQDEGSDLVGYSDQDLWDQAEVVGWDRAVSRLRLEKVA